jgi:hypothetical protein
MDNDRVSTLEQQFAKMEAREVDIQQKLELLLSHALQKPTQPLPTSPVFVPTDPASRTDLRHSARIARPANPPEFVQRFGIPKFLSDLHCLCPKKIPG